MAKAAYVPPTVEFGEGTETRAGNAHLRLPFGLCKKYGINLPKDATPRDAWNALKGIGIDPGEEYDKFAENADKDGEEKDTTPKASENASRADKVFSDSKDRFTYDNSFTQEYARGQFDAGDDYPEDINEGVITN